MNEVLNILKKATTNLHAETEIYAYSKEIRDRTLNGEMYEDLLLKTHYIHQHIQLRLKASKVFSNSPFEAFYFSRLLQLEKDLHNFDSAKQNIKTTFQIDLDTLPKVVGSLYVVEGSTLGGQVIHKLLRKNSNLYSYQPFHFFADSGKQIGQRWRVFAQLAEQHIQTEFDLQESKDAALLTFQFFNDIYKEIR